MNRRTFLKYLGLGSIIAVVPAVVESKPKEDILDLVNEAIEKEQDMGGYVVPKDIAEAIDKRLQLDNWANIYGTHRKIGETDSALKGRIRDIITIGSRSTRLRGLL